MDTYEKPLPDVTDETRPFWEGLKKRSLVLQRCSACEHLRYPISEYCPRCLDESYEWTLLSGRGEVASTLVFHQVYNKAFAADVPYNVSLIQLDEGPRMISNVIDTAPSDVAVGNRVEIVFDDVTDEITVPRFRLVEGDPGRDT